ncbi:hypothetical protein KC875_08780 [Enterobacter hormaechei]|uniref:hypothetical protein n=1 Tax=Enterobacter hormaechei TaxID=158836 RepID=UPI0012AD337F
MSDTYQAVYDAVRSRISNGDIGSAVENVMRAENVGHYFQMACADIQQSAISNQQSAISNQQPSIHALRRYSSQR